MEEVFEKTLELVRKSPDLAELLREIVDFEEKHKDQPYFSDVGWEWSDLRVEPVLLKKLYLMGILNMPYKGRRKGYLLADREAVKRALEYAEAEQEELKPEEKPIEPTVEIFNDIIGYEDVKKLFIKGLKNRVHFLMVGPPASAKSLFLLCIENIPGAKYVIGSRASKAGIADYLINYKPRILLIDEFDKMHIQDVAVLLSMMETGRVSEMLYGKTREVELDTVVFAAANTLKRLPPEARSRFQILHFTEYSEDEFKQVVVNVLKRRGVDEDLAQYIAQRVWSTLGSKDPREAIRIAKLASTKEEVDEVIDILKKHR
jgi:Holliday junction DNA helicase RuvB